MTDPKGAWSDGGKVWNGEPMQGATICPQCQATVLSTSQPDAETDQFHPGKCLPDCMMPDGGECCPGYVALYDAYWHLMRRPPAALAATPAVGGEAVAWLVPSDETGFCRIWWRDKERAEAWLAKHPTCTLMPLYAAPPASPLRGRLNRECLENLNATDDGDPAGNLFNVLKRGFAALGWAQPSLAADALIDALSASPPEQPAAAPVTGRDGIGFIGAMDIVERGFIAWKDKPHNKKWFKRIDGTPIPNDLAVNIAEAIVAAISPAAPGKESDDPGRPVPHHGSGP